MLLTLAVAVALFVIYRVSSPARQIIWTVAIPDSEQRTELRGYEIAQGQVLGIRFIARFAFGYWVEMLEFEFRSLASQIRGWRFLLLTMGFVCYASAGAVLFKRYSVTCPVSGLLPFWLGAVWVAIGLRYPALAVVCCLSNHFYCQDFRTAMMFAPAVISTIMAFFWLRVFLAIEFAPSKFSDFCAVVLTCAFSGLFVVANDALMAVIGAFRAGSPTPTWSVYFAGNLVGALFGLAIFCAVSRLLLKSGE